MLPYYRPSKSPPTLGANNGPQRALRPAFNIESLGDRLCGPTNDLHYIGHFHRFSHQNIGLSMSWGSASGEGLRVRDMAIIRLEASCRELRHSILSKATCSSSPPSNCPLVGRLYDSVSMVLLLSELCNHESCKLVIGGLAAAGGQLDPERLLCRQTADLRSPCWPTHFQEPAAMMDLTER